MTDIEISQPNGTLETNMTVDSGIVNSQDQDKMNSPEEIQTAEDHQQTDEKLEKSQISEEPTTVPEANGNMENGDQSEKDADSAENNEIDEDENENEKNQENENSAEEKPLFEQNIKLAEGTTRKRKSTAFLNDELNNQKQISTGPWTAPNGAGVLLQYHTKVAKTIRQMENEKKFEDLKVIYKFLYNGNCKKAEVRARILKFKGLGWTKEDLLKDPESEETKKLDETDFKHQEMLGLYTNSNLKWAMKTLGIQMPPSKEKMVEVKDKEGNVVKDEKTGQPKMVKRFPPPDKDMMIANCMTWLYKPVKFEEPKPIKKVDSKKKDQDKKKASGSNNNSGSGKKRPANDDNKSQAPKQPKFDLSSVSKELKDKLKENSKSSESGNNSSSNKNSKSNANTKPKQPKNSDKSDNSNNSPKSNKENKEPATAQNGDAKPVTKKAPPKPSQIKKFIHTTLKNANLEDVTMKTVCNAIYDRWPDFRERLIGRKSEIKMWIKEYIANT